MIAISSHKPHAGNPGYRDNQVRALRSWVRFFSRIIYLGAYEPELKAPCSEFYPSEDFPRIKDIALKASVLPASYVTLINADIYLDTPFKEVISAMHQSSKSAGLSRRFMWDTSGPVELAQIEDFGLDIFIAKPVVWQRVAKEVPEELRIGHIRWDTWMYGFLRTIYKGGLADFSHFKCVFHPRHSGEPAPYNSDMDVNDRYTRFAGLPVDKL